MERLETHRGGIWIQIYQHVIPDNYIIDCDDLFQWYINAFLINNFSLIQNSIEIMAFINTKVGIHLC